MTPPVNDAELTVRLRRLAAIIRESLADDEGAEAWADELDELAEYVAPPEAIPEHERREAGRRYREWRLGN